jgi:hypothetical protein
MSSSSSSSSSTLLKLSFVIVALLAIYLPLILEHSISPTPIPGLVDSHLFSSLLSSRTKTRSDKSFGSHPDKAEPQHPFTAAAGRAGIHADAAASDVHLRGPNGRKSTLKMVSRVGSKFPGGMCATLTFNKKGYLIALCASLRRFELHMFEPKTLELLAMFPLPNRPSTFAMLMTLDPTKMMLDTSGGAYYFLDNEDRVVLGDAQQHLRRIGHRQDPETGKFEFYDVNDWDVSFMIPQDCMNWNNWFPSKDPEACDPITAVIPDFQGNIWFVTRRGIVGVLDPKKGKVIARIHLHEEMQNGLTAGEDGVWIVTDKALYCVKVAAAGPEKKKQDLFFQPKSETDGLTGEFEIQHVWSATYDRGTFRKVGMLSTGSGTTPTLFDGRFVTITDNKDDQIQLLVYDLQNMKKQIKSGKKLIGFSDQDQNEGPLVCKHGIFPIDRSASDNSMIAVDGSIFMENNCGYHNAIQQQKWSRKQIPGGVVRVDLVYEHPNNKTGKITGCKTVWESNERAPSCVAKLGSEQGLLYYYTLQQEDENVIEDEEEVGGISSLINWLVEDEQSASARSKPFWALTAVDAHSGKTIFKVPTGRGRNFDNNWGPVTLGPDGTAYVGVIRGIIAIYDSEE